MAESVNDTLTRLLRYQRVPTRLTRTFRTWKHNADILPRLQLQIEMLLEAHGKFEPVVYDTQGILDDGTDVVLRYRPVSGETDPRLIGFQVKSFDDLVKKTYMQELKAQRDDAFRKVHGLQYYYLLICTDSTAHKDRLRNIMAEFRSAKQTEVIEPEFAFTFLHHPKTRVEALVKRVMEAEDLVFRLAIESVEFSSPSARALVLFMAVRYAVTGSRGFAVAELVQESMLRTAYADLREQQAALLDAFETDRSSQVHRLTDNLTSDADEEPPTSIDTSVNWNDEEDEPVQIAEFEDQLAADLVLLESNSIDLDSDSGAAVLRTEQLRALNAVVADALARYEYEEEHLLAYMYSLFGVRD